MFLSIMGMYEYDNTIFDGLTLPNGVNRFQIIDNILLNCAELELLYQDIDIMKRAIELWSASEQTTWEKMYATMNEEYNPIWNVDATVTRTGSYSTDREGNNTDVNSVQGYNANTWADANKNAGSFTNGEDTTESVTERRTGNIGVTATQDLIKKEREIADFSIIRYITESFKTRFCLMIY